MSSQPARRDRARTRNLRARAAALLLPVVLVGALLAPAEAAPAVPAVKTAAKKPWKPTEGAKFNVPRVGGERQLRLENQVIAAINRARPGSYIRMAMFSFDRHQVADALIRAKKRGVWVQVIVNNHEMPSAQRKLRKALGNRTVTRTWKDKNGKKHKKVVQRRQFHFQCVSACRGDGDVQHSKFVLFTHTGGARNVVMLGSLNMKLNGSLNQFNDLLTINDNKRFHSVLNEVFDEMRADRVLKNSYRKYAIGKRFQLEVMPFARKKATRRTKWTPARDPIVKLLAPIRCTCAQTNSGRTIVRVNMHAWDGDRGSLIANKLWDLYNKGCDVKMHVGYAGKKVRDIFARPTKRGRVPFRSTGFDTDEDGEIDLYSHAKILLVNGNYDGVRNRKMVVTGSSNFQNGGQYGDELILRVYSPAIYRQYADNWGELWNEHTHGFDWSVYGARTANGLVAPRYTLSDGLGTDSEEWRDK
ncbi:phospholipase D-like domain-containing protein [Nocardioides daphniae]|uniref:phospholipase D n=1 Tax=Nocardioides daphniae TaxID=402297 RepID=A0A4P7UGF4_9ACTN|nr:phospholipase D-like domain-containing protein [Nocardioides daphniae]QCC77819.1 hypothetical protein E2C04_12680 [Nocardioides daphniae]GGD28001.1 hypothetical protein GCM10007231_29370 [Nocardioides daphniae]